MDILEWLRLDIFMSLAGLIVLITQIIKAAPVELTSNYPKTIAWIVTAIVIGVIAFIDKADPATAVTIGTAVGFAANGLYDVIAGLLRKF